MKKRIQALFEEKRKSLSFEEIKAGLSLGKEKQRLHEAIDALLREGILFEGKRGKLSYSSFYIRGLLTVRFNKTAFVSDRKDGKRYEVKNYSEWGALNRDEVLVDPKTFHVLRVLTRHTYYVTGSVEQDRKGRFHFLSDVPLPEEYRVVNWKNFKPKKKTLVAGHISSYERKEITLEKTLGALGSLTVSQQAILYSHHLPTVFPREVLAEAEKYPDTVKIEDYPTYRDLTSQWAVTIDGDDSKDYDDAISLMKTDKEYVLGVHIADVAHYVKENSPLDKEAKERGTSVYYPNSVIPMLPEHLSNGLCSLNPHENRLTLTVEIHYDFGGQRKSYKIYPAVIRSHARLSYRKVNDLYCGKESYSEEETVSLLEKSRELAHLLQAKAQKKGMISFETKEAKFVVEKEKVTEILLRERGEAEMLIESFMIEANCAVAEFLATKAYPGMYRNHDIPKKEKIETFFNEVAKLGYHFPENSECLEAKDYAKCLEYFQEKDAYPVVNDMLLRSMAKAKYGEEPEGHFALGKEFYAHFTSPIRRYPDLFVHRMLHRYLLGEKKADLEKDKKRAKLFAAMSNEREGRAVQIEREMNDLLQVWYMADHVGEYFDGVISGLTSFGIFVELPNTVEGMIPLRKLDRYFTLQEDGSLTDGETIYRFGDKIEVRLVAVDRGKRIIDFALSKPKKKRRMQKWR